MNSIVERIVFVRKKLKCSVDELSKITGYSYNYLKSLEFEEERNPSDELLCKISEISNVNLAWLKDGTGEPGEISGNVIDTEVANRFYKLRKEKKITIKQLSELIGISPSTIDRIENSKTRITKRQLVKMAKALSVGYDWLAYGDEDAKDLFWTI